MWGMGADILGRQVNNIEQMLAHEIQLVKKTALQFSEERDRLLEKNVLLEKELNLLKGTDSSSEKRKAEEKAEEELNKLLQGLVDVVATLKRDLEAKDQEIASLKEDHDDLRTILVPMLKYIRDHDAIMDANWAAEFKNLPRFPAFPDILPPEAIADAPEQGATEEQKEEEQ